MRDYRVKKITAEELTFLFPKEIISRLDTLAALIPVNLSCPIKKPGEIEFQLEVLDGVLDHIVLRTGKDPVSKIHALPPMHLQYLAYWILDARRKAYELLEKQPETPLGFEKSPRGVLSNILFASWFDLTQGGKIDIEWEEIP